MLVILIVGSFVGAVVLRGACALYNLFVGRNEEEASPQTDVEEPEAGGVNSETNPYGRPHRMPATPFAGGAPLMEKGVPDISFLTAFYICFATCFLNQCLSLAITSALIPLGLPTSTSLVLLGILWVFTGILMLALFLKYQLPTTFLRALKVALIFLLIGTVIIVFVMFAWDFVPSVVREALVAR